MTIIELMSDRPSLMADMRAAVCSFVHLTYPNHTPPAGDLGWTVHTFLLPTSHFRAPIQLRLLLVASPYDIVPRA
jgi:hypothetical protein